MTTPDDPVARARAFAIAAHGEQRYGEHPYSVHLDDVAAILRAQEAGAELVVMAYLHDVVEDTAVTVAEVEEGFGPGVARCVALLTDAPGPDRKARKRETYARLARVPQDSPEARALTVKAADRLANVRRCVDDGRERLLATYRREHPTFRGAAFRPGLCDGLWDELDRLLA